MKSIAKHQAVPVQAWTLGLVLALPLAGACATSTPKTAAESLRKPDVTGVWHAFRQDHGGPDGDSRDERQEWHLHQRGDDVTGYYLVETVVTSGDGRPFLCSQSSEIHSFHRVEVGGSAREAGFDVEELSIDTGEDRCHPPTRPLRQWKAALRGNVVTLQRLDAPPGSDAQTLFRSNAGSPLLSASGGQPGLRNASVEMAAARSVNLDASAGPAPAVDVTGSWVWEASGPGPGGDAKTEREEWHLEQQGAIVTGYYDRVVRQMSLDGKTYRCNGELEFETGTRFMIRGVVRGASVILVEEAFEVVAPSPCDNGRRRLDAYQGIADGEELRLAFGGGGQILRRPRPDVPTQRF